MNYSIFCFVYILKRNAFTLVYRQSVIKNAKTEDFSPKSCHMHHYNPSNVNKKKKKQFFAFLQVVALISITFIICSTVVLTLNTLPYFDKRDENNNERDYPPFALLEAIYMSWFTFEFLVSF